MSDKNIQLTLTKKELEFLRCILNVQFVGNGEDLSVFDPLYDDGWVPEDVGEVLSTLQDKV